ncbi:MAG: LysM peptidoglycan-binding domain-containing protein [Verrucomicrobiota bacterium]
MFNTYFSNLSKLICVDIIKISLRYSFHKFSSYIVAFVFIIIFTTSLSHAQFTNPSSREDAAIEREKILRTADQIDILWQKVEAMQKDITFLKSRIKELETENSQLTAQLDDQVKSREQNKQKLLKEVTAIVKENTSSSLNSKTSISKTIPSNQQNTGTSERGYEHIVASGETIWAIANAYQKQGVKVKVQDILQANNLQKADLIKVGQKLFIPIK